MRSPKSLRGVCIVASVYFRSYCERLTFLELDYQKFIYA